MREGIIEQLPTIMPDNKIVVIAGPSNTHGQSALKSLAAELNRTHGRDWVRVELGKSFGNGVSKDAAVILTMNGIDHGSLTNIRKAVKGMENSVCPNQALTVGEVKESLGILAERRKKAPTLPTGKRIIDDDKHPLPGKGEAQRLAEMNQSAQKIAVDFSAALKPSLASVASTLPDADLPEDDEAIISEANVPATQTDTPNRDGIPETPKAPQSSDLPDDVQTVIETIQSFRASCDDVQVAVLMVGDQLKNALRQCNELTREIATKDGEIAKLNIDLTNAQEALAAATKAAAAEKEGLEAQNQRLACQLKELQESFNGMDKIFTRVKQVI